MGRVQSWPVWKSDGNVGDDLVGSSFKLKGGENLEFDKHKEIVQESSWSQQGFRRTCNR